MKALITGGTGLLGRALMRAFADCGEVVGISRTRTGEGVRQLDLNDFDAVTKLVEQMQPDVIVHSAALRRPDDCEADRSATRKFNVELPEHLARLAKEHEAWLLYISTDYVFDGTSPPYKPSAKTNPLNFYGETKRDGETRARAADWGAGVLRVPVLYGPVQSLDESSVTQQFKTVLAGPAETVVDDYYRRYPTHVEDVAKVCRLLADRKMDHCGLSGIWHFSGSQLFTKYGMAVAMAKAMGLSHQHLKPRSEAPAEVPGQAASRPFDCKLECTTLRMMGIKIPSLKFEERIVGVLQPFVSAAGPEGSAAEDGEASKQEDSSA